MPFVPLWRMVLLCFDRGFQTDSLVYLFAYATIETQDSFFDIYLAGCVWNFCSILAGRGLVASVVAVLEFLTIRQYAFKNSMQFLCGAALTECTNSCLVYYDFSLFALEIMKSSTLS